MPSFSSPDGRCMSCTGRERARPDAGNLLIAPSTFFRRRTWSMGKKRLLFASAVGVRRMTTMTATSQLAAGHRHGQYCQDVLPRQYATARTWKKEPAWHGKAWGMTAVRPPPAPPLRPSRLGGKRPKPDNREDETGRAGTRRNRRPRRLGAETQWPTAGTAASRWPPTSEPPLEVDWLPRVGMSGYWAHSQCAMSLSS
ncbi:hypothetical protein DCS_06958 [Drechmeria coniospora]|uniref:Uncharacterized protein n=1 Tax=Drechmeria coniospora TaxID=98403 RepID=A0A151GD14_DRECN|nr:hypothetical protein DCS_06958 [Drechmeria coniospora]KYK54997.1 hypothetical protein DCS_06958 [Drechmeria coniospora]ODA84289.1 hypothetical protein RJ55_02808 [Drechmeria coniospora]